MGRFRSRVAYTIFSAALWSNPLLGTEYEVSSAQYFQDLINRPGGLNPGDIVRVSPGVYTDWNITITAESSGTAQNPVLITGYSNSETNRQTVFSGPTRFVVEAAHIRFEKMHFENSGAPVITVRGTSSKPAWFNRFSKLFFNGCGQGCIASSYCNQAVFHFDSYGRKSRLDHSVFRDTRAGISVMLHYLAADNRIDQNLFTDIRSVPGVTNGLDAIHIGAIERGEFSEYKKYETRVQVDHNIFLRVQGEKEIISNKTYGNEFIANLFLHSDSGLLSLRGGGRAKVIGNVFLNTNGGISVNGESHEITGNLLVTHRTSTSRNIYGSAGIEFMVGSHNDQAATTNSGPLISYLSARNVTLQHNTVIGGYIRSSLPASPVGMQRVTYCGVDSIGQPIPCDEIPFGNEFRYNRLISMQATPLFSESGPNPQGLLDAFFQLNLLSSNHNRLEQGVSSFESSLVSQIRAVAQPDMNQCLKLDEILNPLPHGSRFQVIPCDSQQDAMLSDLNTVGRIPIRYPLVLPKTKK